MGVQNSSQGTNGTPGGSHSGVSQGQAGSLHTNPERGVGRFEEEGSRDQITLHHNPGDPGPSLLPSQKPRAEPSFPSGSQAAGHGSYVKKELAKAKENH